MEGNFELMREKLKAWVGKRLHCKVEQSTLVIGLLQVFGSVRFGGSVSVLTVVYILFVVDIRSLSVSFIIYIYMRSIAYC